MSAKLKLKSKSIILKYVALIVLLSKVTKGCFYFIYLEQCILIKKQDTGIRRYRFS